MIDDGVQRRVDPNVGRRDTQAAFVDAFLDGDAREVDPRQLVQRLDGEHAGDGRIVVDQRVLRARLAKGLELLPIAHGLVEERRVVVEVEHVAVLDHDRHMLRSDVVVDHIARDILDHLHAAVVHIELDLVLLGEVHEVVDREGVVIVLLGPKVAAKRGHRDLGQDAFHRDESPLLVSLADRAGPQPNDELVHAAFLALDALLQHAPRLDDEVVDARCPEIGRNLHVARAHQLGDEGIAEALLHGVGRLDGGPVVGDDIVDQEGQR